MPADPNPNTIWGLGQLKANRVGNTRMPSLVQPEVQASFDGRCCPVQHDIHTLLD